MDINYLQELIEEAKKRGGGMILNMQDKPEVVVLTIERYNQLLGSASATPTLPIGEEQTGYLYNHFEPKKGKKVLVTGGAGYIGAHVVRQLLANNHEVVVLDNLSTGKRDHVPQEVKFIEGDLADVNLLRDLFASEHFDAVIHMAASIEVEESVRQPVQYLQNNAINTEKLLMVMAEAGVKNIIFSSTAAVYGESQENPVTENAHVRPNNPYGYSKLMAERMIKYYCHFCGFKGVVFRYFNACGSDFDGLIGSSHTSHLIPTVLKVAQGKLPYITIHGKDYHTVDGTAVRDYVHVLDIARAHVLALEKIDQVEDYKIFNIGTGKGLSVCEIINKASEVLGHIIPMEVGSRRPGDAEITVADNSKIRQELGFKLEHSDLETIIQTSWAQVNRNT